MFLGDSSVLTVRFYTPSPQEFVFYCPVLPKHHWKHKQKPGRNIRAFAVLTSGYRGAGGFPFDAETLGDKERLLAFMDELL